MEDEYIKKDDALACIEGYRERDGSIVSPDELPEYQRIERLPAADVRENRHGQWLHVMDGAECKCWECSECREQWIFEEGRTPYDEEVYFCPSCGADMRTRTEEDDG